LGLKDFFYLLEMRSVEMQSTKMNRPGLVKAGGVIEKTSFSIIDEEMGEHDFPPDQWQIVRRIIHATGDFDYARLARFHPDAVGSAIGALRRGATIFTDTRMVQVGLSPWRLDWFGNNVVTPSINPESQRWAEEAATTRSVAAMRHYSAQFTGNIVAIGNAPTALLELVKLIREERVRPALVIGVPVGFVRAAESKDELRQLQNQPAITTLGRKGGSAVAVAVVHALFELAKSLNIQE
jgi:precorrin-8X/cobalt-precorrin-8 methylmutase